MFLAGDLDLMIFNELKAVDHFLQKGAAAIEEGNLALNPAWADSYFRSGMGYLDEADKHKAEAEYWMGVRDGKESQTA